MTETIVIPGPFAPIILEDDPAFDVQKEYQEELDYYYETHPNDKGYIPPKSLKESAIGAIGGIRNALEKVVEVRDQLYGYNDDTKGPRIHLKPVAEMNFLPDGMNYGGGAQQRNQFDMGLTQSDFFITRREAPKKEKKQSCHEKKKPKRLDCCSCKDTGCLDNPRHCSKEKKSKKESSTMDIFSSDPFGITKKRD